MKRTAIAVLLLVSFGYAADKAKSLYKVVHINESVVGISCPGNHGDPTVITNAEGTLLVSCGTR